MTMATRRGRPAFQPSEEQRCIVEAMVGFGIPEAEICGLIRNANGKPIGRWAKTLVAPTDERRGITSEARNWLARDPLFGYHFAPVWGTIPPDGEARKTAVFLGLDFQREFESVFLQQRVRV